MGLPKLTGFIIGLILISFAAFSLNVYLGGMMSSWHDNFENDSLTFYDNYQNLSEDIELSKNKATNITETTGVLDIVGDFFGNAYSVLKTSVQSFSIFEDMTQDATSRLGVAGEGIKNLLLLTTIVLLFIGVIVAVLVRRERL